MIVSEAEIVNALQNGEVVGIPTDTVYGLATLYGFEHKIYDLKNRDANKKLVTFVKNSSQVLPLDEYSPEEFEKFIHKYWPGNNTLIFKKSDEWKSFRIPSDKSIQSLLDKINAPIYTTSANLSGLNPCVTQEQFVKMFPNIKLLEEKCNSPKSKKPSNIIIISKDGIKKIR